MYGELTRPQESSGLPWPSQWFPAKPPLKREGHWATPGLLAPDCLACSRVASHAVPIPRTAGEGILRLRAKIILLAAKGPPDGLPGRVWPEPFPGRLILPSLSALLPDAE